MLSFFFLFNLFMGWGCMMQSCPFKTQLVHLIMLSLGLKSGSTHVYILGHRYEIIVVTVQILLFVHFFMDLLWFFFDSLIFFKFILSFFHSIILFFHSFVPWWSCTLHLMFIHSFIPIFLKSFFYLLFETDSLHMGVLVNSAPTHTWKEDKKTSKKHHSKWDSPDQPGTSICTGLKKNV
jgi:hypothetical protein